MKARFLLGIVTFACTASVSYAGPRCHFLETGAAEQFFVEYGLHEELPQEKNLWDRIECKQAGTKTIAVQTVIPVAPGTETPGSLHAAFGVYGWNEVTQKWQSLAPLKTTNVLYRCEGTKALFSDAPKGVQHTAHNVTTALSSNAVGASTRSCAAHVPGAINQFQTETMNGESCASKAVVHSFRGPDNEEQLWLFCLTKKVSASGSTLLGSRTSLQTCDEKAGTFSYVLRTANSPQLPACINSVSNP